MNINRNIDWAILTIVLVAIVASGLFVFMQVEANNELIQKQMELSAERFQSNRQLIQQMGEESRKRDELQREQTLTYDYKNKWCAEAMKLNPGWKCPKD